MTKNKDFDLGNILLDEKLNEIIYFITFHTKVWLVLNLCMLDKIKQIDLSEFMVELDI